MLIVRLTLAFFMMGPQGPGIPQKTVEQGVTHARRYTEIEIADLLKKAEGGNAGAQAAVGRAYADGNGVPQDFRQAQNWYHKAADQGNAEAENEIGILYRTGSGVEKSKEEALNWYRKGASHGSATAMFNVGAAYYNGDGTNVDDEKAYIWFLAAAAAGDSGSQEAADRSATDLNYLHLPRFNSWFELAEMYRVGRELPQSQEAAAMWYRKAATAGNFAAQMRLVLMMLSGEIPQDYAQARDWSETAAKKHYSPGAFCMGLMYRKGAFGTASETDAAKWFARAAELGNGSAMFYLGQDYWKGDGVKQDKGKAYQWLLLARSSGNLEADQNIELIRKELSAEQMKRVEKKAMNWSMEHRLVPLEANTRP